MKKSIKLLLIILLPIICITSVCLSFLLPETKADPNSPQIEQTLNAEDTGASKAGKDQKGGAVYVERGSTYTMTGGSMSAKERTYGGAVYVANGGTFTMMAGTITGCAALYGGAIYIEAGGVCNIEGGNIVGNKAQYAPAIYVEEGGILNISSSAVIQDNLYEKWGNPIEIYVDGTLAKTMYVKADTYQIKEEDMPFNMKSVVDIF